MLDNCHGTFSILEGDQLVHLESISSGRVCRVNSLQMKIDSSNFALLGIMIKNIRGSSKLQRVQASYNLGERNVNTKSEKHEHLGSQLAIFGMISIPSFVLPFPNLKQHPHTYAHYILSYLHLQKRDPDPKQSWEVSFHASQNLCTVQLNSISSQAFSTHA